MPLAIVQVALAQKELEMIGYWIAVMRCGCLDKGTSEWLDSPKVGTEAYCTEHGITDYLRIEAHN